MAPLIRFTLISLYLALVLPLPVLAPTELQAWLWAALPLGLVLILALVSEQVELSDERRARGPSGLVWLGCCAAAGSWDWESDHRPHPRGHQPGRARVLRENEKRWPLPAPERVQAFGGFSEPLQPGEWPRHQQPSAGSARPRRGTPSGALCCASWESEVIFLTVNLIG